MDIEDELFEDAFEDERYEDRSTLIQTEQFELEQSLISMKHEKNVFTVNRELINSKLYHDKFEYLPVNRKVQEALYRETGRLLEFVDGQEQERMVAVNARTGDFVVDNFKRFGSGSIAGTGFNDKEYQKVQECHDGIIIVHNHSLNGRPSIQDVLTYANEDRIKLSIIACHDGTLYSICGISSKFMEYYSYFLQKEKLVVSDMDIAKQLATSDLYQLNDTLSERHKLINMTRL